MNTCKIHEIKGYIQSIYLVEEDNILFLLDGCARPDVIVVKSFIENELKRPFNDLKLVISTHAHPDHMGGLYWYKQLGIKITGPENLCQWYQGMNGLITYWVDIFLTYLVALTKKRGFKNVMFPREIVLDFTLDEGDSILNFEHWRVLSCPGHTGVDLNLMNTNENIIYVADNFVGSTRNVFRPYPIRFPRLYRNSLKRYLDLGVSDFLLAHHGRVQIPQTRIQELIDGTSNTPRRHLNSLPAILAKVFKSLFK